MFGRKRILDRHIRKTFLVFLENGGAFQAALLSHDATDYEFAMVKVIQDDEMLPAVGGTVVIGRAKVAYLQKVALVDAAQ